MIHNQDEKEEEEGEIVEDIRMSNFSQVIALLFVTVVMLFLFIKILFF
jgi:hypothetical protein